MRLIDADEEIRFANENLPDVHAGVITAFLSDCSTIDPVHAAGACYCWECRSYNKPRIGYCSHHMDKENPNDFCGYGVKKGEG